MLRRFLGTCYKGIAFMRLTLISTMMALLVCGVCSKGVADNAEPKAEARATELGLEKLLQAPPGATATWEALKGNVVVMEFWATWCGPCIASFPHLNKLADEFKDKPVKFIAVTDEDEEAIRGFLEHRTIKGWIGLDPDRSAFSAFGIKDRPTTVVINAKGEVAAKLYPIALDKKLLDDVLSGKPLSVAEEPPPTEGVPHAPAVPAAEEPKPIFAVTVGLSRSEGSSTSVGPGVFRADGIAIKNVISMVYHIASPRVKFDSALAAERVRVEGVMPKGAESSLEPLLEQAVKASFGLSIRREKIETDVLVLAAPRGLGSKLWRSKDARGKGHSARMSGVYAAGNTDLSTFVQTLEDMAGKPVLDETGLTGRFDWQMEYKDGDAESFMQAVREQLGLDLTAAKREVEVLVVSAQNAPAGAPPSNAAIPHP
jgi:uncharacterized protein (TIGR03435 family)